MTSTPIPSSPPTSKHSSRMKSDGNIITTKLQASSPPKTGNVGGSHLQQNPEILLEGWMVKQSRNKYWQDRYFVFKSDQTISYKRKQDENEPSRATFRVSNEAGCEVSDLFVDQRSTGPGSNYYGMSGGTSSIVGTGKKETLYCVTLSWPDDTTTTTELTQHTTATGNDGEIDDVAAAGEIPIMDNDDESVHAATGTATNAAIPMSPLSVSSHHKPKRGLRKKFKLSSTTTTKSAAAVEEMGLVPMADEMSLKSGQSFGSRTSQLRKSILRRRPLRRGRSAPSTDKLDYHHSKDAFDTNYDAGSYSSLLDPPRNTTTTDPRQSSPSVPFSGMTSMPNMKVDLRPRPNKIPTEVQMEIMEEHNDDNIVDNDDKNDDFVPLNDDTQTSLRQSLKEEYGVTSPPFLLEKKASYEDQTLQEQEMLRSIFLRKQRDQRDAMAKRAVGVTKVAVAASAAIGVGIITAGVGLVAGLVFLGGAAAVGGTAGVAEVGLRRTLKRKDHLTIATPNYELAKLWKTMLDSCLEQESLKRSTWGQLFVADGRRTTSTLIAHDAGDILHSLSVDDEDNGYLSGPTNSPKDRSNLQTNIFLRDPKFFSHPRARWRPVDGGWTCLLSGAPSIRIFKEESVQLRTDESTKVAPMAVRGSTTPFRTQVVLNAHPMEAFMCIMSYARMHTEEVAPNSGQASSFRLIEKIDEHTDVLHLVFRKLFLFPFWTEPRDYVLLRYWRYEPDGSYIICYESIEHSECPPQPGFIRGDLHQVYTIAPPKTSDHRRLRGTAHAAEECMLTAVVQVDPKGWIPTKALSILSDQSYADAFGVSALLQTLDVRDAIEVDRFLETSPDLHPSPSMAKDGNAQSRNVMDVSDLRYMSRERCDSFTVDKFPNISSHPVPLGSDKWAEPDSNSFLVRGPTYKSDRVKVNAGNSIGQLIAVDVVHVDEPQYGGMSLHPSERIQLALKREESLKAMGKASDVPPFIFVVNIILPGPPFYHGVFYFAVDDMTTIDGSDGSPSSKLCQRFLFGDSDEFRDNTFKLIPRIVEGNFLVRKAVGSTPAIMGTKLKQYYVQNERFMEVILDCGSSPVATGVIRLSLGYAKTLVVDMGFLLEGDSDEFLPEKMMGAVRIKYPSFGTHLRKVETTQEE